MVGGIIIDIVKVSDAKWWVNCVETGTSSQAGKETCAIYVNPIGEPIDVGDNLWWQGDQAMWTPDDRSRADVRLPRIGFSGVPHPHWSQMETP
jgi:hypothetical protein